MGFHDQDERGPVIINATYKTNFPCCSPPNSNTLIVTTDWTWKDEDCVCLREILPKYLTKNWPKLSIIDVKSEEQ